MSDDGDGWWALLVGVGTYVAIGQIQKEADRRSERLAKMIAKEMVEAQRESMKQATTAAVIDVVPRKYEDERPIVLPRCLPPPIRENAEPRIVTRATSEIAPIDWSVFSDTRWLVAVMLLLFWPVGICMLFHNKTFALWVKWILAAGSFGLYALIMIGGAASAPSKKAAAELAPRDAYVQRVEIPQQARRERAKVWERNREANR